MKTAAVAAVLAAVGATSALPHAASKASDSVTINDGFILNYALTLEHLEDTFYRTGLAKFSQKDFAAAGFTGTFYNNIKEVAFDEKTHVSFLTGALQAAGVTPVQECTYNFNIPDVKTFIATASILEGVGVSAYLGAAASIANKAYLTAAGSILTVEARHSSYLRAGLKQSPFPQPFDDPLDFKEVFTLAAPFIKSCPKSSPSLGLKAFPSLSLTSSSPPKTGSEITLVAGSKVKKDEILYLCFITVTGPVCEPAYVKDDCKTIKSKIPAGVFGQSYAVLTTCKTSVTDDTTVAGPALIEIAGTAGSH